MKRRVCFYLTLVSYAILVAVSIAWPRSYFYADKWWVENTAIQQGGSLPPGAMWSTGWDPTRWSHGVAWFSGAGCLTFHHADYVFAPGELVSQRLSHPVTTRAWLPTRKVFGFTVPYWCIALAAAILPAVSLRREFAGKRILSYRITLFFFSATVASLVLTGFVNLGTGGAIICLEVAAATFIAVSMARRRLTRTSKMNSPALSRPTSA